MQPVLESVMAKRRDKCIAIMLSVKERECDNHLPPETQKKLRKVILDQMNDYHDLAADLMRSLDSGDVVLNEVFVERLDMISNQLARVEAEVASAVNSHG